MKTVLAVLIGIVLATPAFAGIVRFTWGPANQLVSNQPYAGNTTYEQTLSVTGVSGSIQTLELVIQYGSPSGTWSALYPSMDGLPYPAPRPDCTGAPGFTVQSAVAGATPLPGANLLVSVSSFPAITRPVTYGFMQVRLQLDQPFIANPSTRYGIATLQYHLQNATSGAGPCGDVEQPFCWLGAYINTSTFPAYWENHEPLSWQNASGAYNCYTAVTPARVSTWGSIKQIYR